MARIGTALAGIALLALGLGCGSISDSVTSPSRWAADSSTASADSSGASADSSNNSSQSSSGSSSGDDEAPAESAYRDDVRVATRSLAASGAPEDQLSRELSRVAQQHGISHWEGHAGTWIAMGTGMREAGLTQADVEVVLVRLGGVDTGERELVLEGYGATL